MLNEHDTDHEFRFDQEIFVSPNWNVFLHETEVVEATKHQSTAVHPQIEVHLLTAIPAHTKKQEHGDTAPISKHVTD